MSESVAILRIAKIINHHKKPAFHLLNATKVRFRNYNQLPTISFGASGPSLLLLFATLDLCTNTVININGINKNVSGGIPNM
jgi:hypothetical protein